MTKILYASGAHATGGRVRHGCTADGGLNVNLSLPKETAREGGGTNPKKLFAVSWAACLESAIAGAARRRDLEVGEISIESTNSLLPIGDGGHELVVARRHLT
jgi:organic hydroperoxide reductase OsmC/OhrA